jgi:hypothetical protein
LDVVEAEDCVGFLASLLWLLDEQDLIPVELRLDTRNGRIFDSLWFRASQSGLPGPDACLAIQRHLASLK